MSVQVTTSMVDMFSANVMHLAQQEESMLWEYCRQESQEGESEFYDRIGLATAKKKQGRHSNVEYDDIPHSRRMNVTEDFYASDLVDKEDKLRTIMNIENEYTVAIASALGRQMDEEIITAALGTAFSGKKGTVAVTLPDAQKIAAFDGASAVGLGLNVATLRATRKKFKQSKAVKAKKKEKIIFAFAAQQADDLLGSTEVTSSDFNSVKALVDGETDTFMGFKFVELELMPFNAAAVTYNVNTGSVGAGGGTIPLGGARECFAFTAKKALLAAMPAKVNGRISEIPEKHYSHQVYGNLSFGAVRMEEVQLILIYCLEA